MDEQGAERLYSLSARILVDRENRGKVLEKPLGASSRDIPSRLQGFLELRRCEQAERQEVRRGARVDVDRVGHPLVRRDGFLERLAFRTEREPEPGFGQRRR